MNLRNLYWYFKSALSNNLCDEIVREGLYHKDNMGITGGSKNPNLMTQEDIKNIKLKRDSNIVWLNQPWIYNEILPFVELANKNSGWNFKWNYSESCQFTKYKLNQYYDWHQDAWDKPYEDGPPKGLIRKLSVTVSLSHPENYQGGELEFFEGNPEILGGGRVMTAKEILPRGSICVFPSFVWHRVKPVISGERFSLVIWNCGECYA